MFCTVILSSSFDGYSYVFACNAMLFSGHILLYLWYESCVCMVGGVMSMGVNFVICGVLSIRCMGCDGGCGAIRFIT
jgi:hypothetical protein